MLTHNLSPIASMGHQPEIETAREPIAFWRWTLTSIESTLSGRLSALYERQRIATEVQVVQVVPGAGIAKFAHVPEWPKLSDAEY